MPLHLLGKKSWNVYNADNIARVRQDEALLAAEEARLDLMTQEQDAAIRTALLRGETPPTFEAVPTVDAVTVKRRRDGRGDGRGDGRTEEERAAEKSDKKERRRKRDEDESAYAIRLAGLKSRADDEARGGVLSGSKRESRRKEPDAPVVDHAGNIQLFLPPSASTVRARDAEAEKSAKTEEPTDTFKSATGTEPWYAGPKTLGAGESAKTNAFGRFDERRPERDAKRMAAVDPLAAIMAAQTQLKKARRDRELWVEEKERESRALEKMHREARRAEKEKARTREREREGQRRGERREGRSRRESVGSLEGFKLDAPAAVAERENRRHRHRDDRERRESRARSRSPAPRHRHTSRSRERAHHSSRQPERSQSHRH